MDATLCLQLEASCLQYNFFVSSCRWDLFDLEWAHVSLPFTPKCLQINSRPVFFFCIFYGNSLRRGYCTKKTKQEQPDSGSTLENIFCTFYEINSSQDCFLYCKHFGVDGIFCLQLKRVFSVRKISPKFSCIKFFPQIRDVPFSKSRDIPATPCLKQQKKDHLHKVFVRDIPTSGSRTSQEYPAQKLYSLGFPS